jgi:very-short-patch-repair endonuclease
VTIEHVLGLYNGCARFKDLAEAGISRQDLRAAVACHRIVRPHRGCYALPGAPKEVVLSTLFRAELTCISWASQVGIPVERPASHVHLGVPASRGLGLPRQRPCDEVVLHRAGAYDLDFAIGHLDIAAACTTPIQQVALLDAALARGFIVPSELRQLSSGSARRRDWIRRRIHAGAQSLGESYARVGLQEAGMRVAPQARLAGVGAVDLLVEGRIVVEVDGYRYHSGKRSFADDRDRDRAVTLLGLTPVRFTHTDAVERLADLVEEVRAVLWRVGVGSESLRTAMDIAARGSEPMWWR